jgi:putative flippase GtrA
MLQHKNIIVLLNSNAKSKLHFDFFTKTVYFENRVFDGIVFFTGAIDEFFDYQLGTLPYRSLDLIFEDIDIEYYQSNSVINYPNEELFTRITEFKYFTPSHRNSGNSRPLTNKTTILKEYPAPYKVGVNEPYYPIINEENCAIYQKYAKAVEEFPNVYLCGRLAEYKYYNMDAVILNALHIAETVKQRFSKKNNFIHNIRIYCPIARELFLYGIIGGFSASLDSVCFFFLRKLCINLYLSNFISINLGISSSFILNTFFNFKMPDKLLVKAFKFFSIGYAGLLLSMLILHIGVKFFGWKDIIVKVCSVFFVAIFQFTLNKAVTFRRKDG